MFPNMFEPMSEEDAAEARAQHDRLVMRGEEITARIRRLIAEELSYEQLEALHAMLAHISNSQSAAVLAHWYEGITNGALAVRDIVLGQKDVDTHEL